jgi:hypothetical protein
MEQRDVPGIITREVIADPEVRCVSGRRSRLSASAARSRNATKQSMRFPLEVSELTQRDGEAVAGVEKLAVSAEDKLRIMLETR